jgi:uncharacterized protein (DUF1330 family)
VARADTCGLARCPDEAGKGNGGGGALVEKFGGRYLVCSGELHAVGGDLRLKRLVILEFPSVEAARRLYGSPKYASALRLRQETARSDIVLVEGW